MRKAFLLLSLFFIIFGFSKKEVSTTLSKEEKTELIKAHNKWRSEVGSPDIQWSEELASKAQAWANHLAKSGCKMVHSKSDEGENIFWATYSATPTEVVDDWASEKKDFRYNKKGTRSFSKIGHYTQVVWKTTKLVGCGRATCKNGNEIWVCNYSPSGNWVGETPY